MVTLSPHAILRVAGCDLAEHFVKISIERGCSLTAAAERDFARDVKQILCYIASDNDTVLTSTRRKRQGENLRALRRKTITVGAERFRYAEVLFQPSLELRDQRHDTSFQCFMKCDVATRKELYTSVVSSGGLVSARRRTDSVGALLEENHGGCSTRERVLGMDLQIFS